MKLELGMFTLILSHIAFSIPFVIVSVRSSLTPAVKVYEEAAQDLGANTFKTFFLITLPTIMPGVISGATLALTLSLDDVVISYFNAGPGSNTLPLKIYSMIKTGITPDVNALSSLMLFLYLNLWRNKETPGIRDPGRTEHTAHAEKQCAKAHASMDFRAGRGF